MKKRVLSVLLTLCLSLGFLPVAVWGVGEELPPPSNLTWDEKGKLSFALPEECDLVEGQLYRNGQLIYERGWQAKGLSMGYGYPCLVMSNWMDKSGSYTVKLRAIAADRMTKSDWATAEPFQYNRPEASLQLPNDFSIGKDYIPTWTLNSANLSYPGTYSISLYKKQSEDDQWLNVWGQSVLFKETSIKSSSLKQQLERINQSGYSGPYGVTIRAVSGNINMVGHSEESEMLIFNYEEGAEPPIGEEKKLVYMEVIAPQYQDARQFSEGLAAVKKDGKWGYIDTEGNTVLPFQFDDAGSFNDGYAVVCTQVEENSYQEDDTWYDCYRYGFINMDGTLTYFDRLEYDDEGGAVLWVVKRGDALPEIGQFYGDYAAQSYSWKGDWGAALFGKDGKQVYLERADGGEPFGSSYELYYPGEWPVTDGTTILTEWVPSNWQDQKYYDFETKTTFKPVYDIPEGEIMWCSDLLLQPFNQGLAPVCVPQDMTQVSNGELWGFINKKGDWVIEPQFWSYIARGTGHQVFYENGENTWATVSKAIEPEGGGVTLERYGVIDKEGKTVIDFKYDILLPFTHGVAVASFDHYKGLGYISAEEQFVIDPKFKHAGPFGDLGVAIVSDVASVMDEPWTSCYLIDINGNKIEGSEGLDLIEYWGLFGAQSHIDGKITAILGAPDEYIIIRDRGEGRPSDEYYGVTVYDDPKFGFGRIASGTPLTKSMFTVTGGDDLTYDGKAKTLTITSETLTEGVDYTVTYTGNTNAGTAKAVIQGKGAYGGKVEFPFTIQPAPVSISAAKVSNKTYNGKTDGKVTSVTFDGLPEGESLTIEKDYTAAAVFADAEIGNDKAVTVTVTLRNKNYILAENTFQTTANIKKRSSGYILTGGSGGSSEGKPPVETPPAQTTPPAETPPVQTPPAAEPVPAPSFTDVAPNAWYYDAVAYVCQKGLMNGTKKDVQFSPEATMTRAMVMTVLARMDGVDTAGGGTWYAKAQSWAVGKGVSSGERPEEEITREQLVTMLWRYAGQPEAAGDLAGFVDGGSVSAYARTAVQWAVEAGLVNGYKDGSFRPRGNAARAEVAAILMRYCESLEK